MKTAVDTSVLLDVFQPDPVFGESSSEALRQAYDEGALVACDVVWAEVRAHFPSDEAFRGAIEPIGLHFDAIEPGAAAEAGRLWRESRRNSKKPRPRVVADFLIGAHAQRQCDRLLTRDDGFYRRHFRLLQVAQPARP